MQPTFSGVQGNRLPWGIFPAFYFWEPKDQVNVFNLENIRFRQAPRWGPWYGENNQGFISLMLVLPLHHVVEIRTDGSRFFWQPLCAR
jgi:hypothetical protein